MRAFDLGAPLAAAGVVLLLMNIAIVFPLCGVLDAALNPGSR